MIDSHPYENVDGDGRPLCRDDADDIAPDYETIFVQQNEENAAAAATAKNATEIDVILSQRMMQNKIANDIDVQTSSSSALDQLKSGVGVGDVDGVDSSKASDDDSCNRMPSNRSSDSLCLFDPPMTSSNGDVSGTQKIRKGDLRLTQMDNGSWRLEDSDRPIISNDSTSTTKTTTTTSTVTSTTASKLKKKKSKDSSNDDPESQQLLRRPSIKKIRALFSKDSSKAETQDPEESKEVLAAISKLPKFDPTCGNLKSESASMPNSLDRRLGHQKSVDQSKILASSENKPSLPVKRSKSMKVISKPVSFLFSVGSVSQDPEPTPTPTPTGPNGKHLVKAHSVIETPVSRSDTFPKNSSVTRFDFENIPRRESFGKDLSELPSASIAATAATSQPPPPPKPVRSHSEYANVFVTSSDPTTDSLRHRISSYVSSRPNSSGSLNADAKKMLKDCQDYLVIMILNWLMRSPLIEGTWNFT